MQGTDERAAIQPPRDRLCEVWSCAMEAGMSRNGTLSMFGQPADRKSRNDVSCIAAGGSSSGTP